LRREGRKRRNAQSVTWPEVYVRGEELDSRPGGSDESRGSDEARRGGRLGLREVRLLFLTYESIMIPLRVAFPELLADSIAATILDVAVDLVEMRAIAQRIKSSGAKPDPQAEAGSADEAISRRSTLYGVRRAAIDVASIASLQCTRIIYACTGAGLPFVLAQILRCVRVYDLLGWVREINSDLSTSVRLLAFWKFFLVLMISPHYLACTWLVLSGGWWHVLDPGRVELPSWPAQLFAESHSPQMDPNAIGAGSQCTCPLVLADSPRRAPLCTKPSPLTIARVGVHLCCHPRAALLRQICWRCTCRGQV
jgi:hypothetical protein